MWKVHPFRVIWDLIKDQVYDGLWRIGFAVAGTGLILLLIALVQSGR